MIEVRAPGKRSIVRKLRIRAKPGTTRVTLPAFDAPRTEAPPATLEKSEEAGTHGGWSTTRVAGAIVTGAGVATMATSGVLILMAKSEWNDAHSSECNGNVCSPDGKQRIDAARDKGTLATIVFGAGAALSVTGAVLFLTAPSSRSESASRPALSVSAAAWQHGSGMAVRGHFRRAAPRQRVPRSPPSPRSSRATRSSASTRSASVTAATQPQEAARGAK